MDQLDKRLTRVEHKLFGNGDVGMDEVLRANTATLARLDAKVDGVRKSVDELRQERRDDQKRAEGRVQLASWVNWVLRIAAVVLAIGAPLGLWRVTNQNRVVIEQLQRLPPLPE